VSGIFCVFNIIDLSAAVYPNLIKKVKSAPKIFNSLRTASVVTLQTASISDYK